MQEGELGDLLKLIEQREKAAGRAGAAAAAIVQRVRLRAQLLGWFDLTMGLTDWKYHTCTILLLVA